MLQQNQSESVRLHRPVAVLLIITSLLCTGLLARAQTRINDLSRRFDAERDPVRRAKLFPKLGDAYLDLLREKTKDEQYEQALALLNAYLDTLRKLYSTLRNTVSDPETKPAGFIQLEKHLRESIRKLSDATASLPVDQRVPFEIDLRDLRDIENELIEALFPRRPTDSTNRRRPDE